MNMVERAIERFAPSGKAGAKGFDRLRTKV
jgi:hypothetical protein